MENAGQECSTNRVRRKWIFSRKWIVWLYKSQMVDEVWIQA